MISKSIRKPIIWGAIAAALICVTAAAGIFSDALVLQWPIQLNWPIYRYVHANFSGEYLTKYWRYKQSILHEHPDGISVSNNGNPAGIFFLYRLDKTLRYRFNFSGINQTNRAIIRIQADDGPKIYRKAPNGELELIFQNKEKIELLLYGDTEFNYSIKQISLEKCESCKSNADLKRQILSEIPQLQKLLEENRMQAARQLLNWCSNNSDFTFSAEIVEKSSPMVLAQTASQTYYKMFEPDKGGVFCAGFAVFYMKVLELFDFDALTVDFGEVDDYLTHVTTVITFIENQVPKHYIFDPTFNVTIRYKDNNEFADLKSIFELFKSKRMTEVFWDEMPMNRDVIFFNSHLVRDRAKSDTCKKVECLSKEAYSCKYDNYSLDDWIRDNKKRIEEHGFSANRNVLIELMLHKIYHINREESDPFVALLREQGVNFQ